MEGIPFSAAIAWGFDGLWLGALPNLLFVPDRDGDDKADVDDIEVRLTGWASETATKRSTALSGARTAGSTVAKDSRLPPWLGSLSGKGASINMERHFP